MTTQDFHNSSEETFSPQNVRLMKDYYQPSQPEPFHQDWQRGVPIAIDLGRSMLRVGMAGQTDPSCVFPSITSRYKDKKLRRSLNMVGYDVFLDSSLKSNLKTPFDGAMITNWDSIETILDYSFLHIGVDSQNKVDSPVLISEVVAPPFQQRFNLMQMLFETYNVPKLAFGVDSLFSFYQNGGHSGLVINGGHNSTMEIPVVRGSPVINVAKRIDWGGQQAVEYLNQFLTMKYPYFPSKVNNYQVENMIHDYCYVSTDYQKELKHYLDLDVLEKKDILLEAPFTEVIKPEKTEEELEQEEKKHKETIKKLQLQARERRLQNLIEKENDYQYYLGLQGKMKSMNKRLVLSTLREAGFDDLEDFTTYIQSLERSLKKARNQDVGENDETDNNKPPSWSLIEVPDEQLDEEQLKEKRKQKLMKANFEARQRANQEKEEAKREADEAARKDENWRNTNLKTWLAARRKTLEKLKKRRKDRIRMKEELSDRKSRASQMRMKNIASLAGDEVQGKNGHKRRAAKVTIDNDPNDTFGANDDDWAIYRDIAKGSDVETEKVEEKKIYNIEEELLKYDSSFTINDTLQRQYNWRNSILHRFLRGPRDFDPDEQHQQHQIHLNIERIRVPEIIFQPSIAGIDQCGLSELCEQTTLKRLTSEPVFSGDDSNEVLKDIFLTGGQSMFEGFEERLRREFQSFLPVGTEFHVRKARDPVNDAWRGMSKWAASEEGQKSFIDKKEYEEMGPDYIRENRMGCLRL
ncbi:hypothetical protein FOA43_004022 [Brettanomyces nanus]|uniref:Actin-related protein 5 n=1 Tax=Eeniella nana TaxID=13502 RepID=A0A875RQD7_EENNA|nr:uncharacterized protein FOA43_004022 [Brettanomyces nanus]QPG76630.1 hypothetical protein FOA43_004022 [Brettanomyces nanus]